MLRVALADRSRKHLTAILFAGGIVVVGFFVYVFVQFARDERRERDRQGRL